MGLYGKITGDVGWILGHGRMDHVACMRADVSYSGDVHCDVEFRYVYFNQSMCSLRRGSSLILTSL